MGLDTRLYTMDADRSIVDLTDEQGEEESKDEFIIDRDKLELITETQEKLYNSFQVTLTLGDTSSDPEYGSKQWIQIDGLPEHRKAAKEYIQTLCSPIEVQPMRYPKELESVLTSPDVLGPVEKHSRAVIRFEQPGEVMIYGDDRVAVTLAYSALEDIISQHLEDSDWDLEASFPKGPGKQASHRLTEELKRRLSTEDRASVSDVDGMNNAIKRAILDVLDYGKGDGDEDLEAFGIVPHEPKEKGVVREKVGGITQPMEDGPSLGEAARQLKHIQINAAQPTEETCDVPVALQKQSSVTEKGKYQKEWALSKGFSKEKIDMVFQKHGYALQFQEFYRILNNIGSTDSASVSMKSQTVDGSGVSSSENMKQAVSTVTMPPENTEPTNQPADSGQKLPSRQVASYIARLSRDHVEEDDVESIDELKQRNAQRQRLLMRIFEKRKDNLEASADEDVTMKVGIDEIDEISLDEIDARPRNRQPHHEQPKDSHRQTEGQGHNSRHQSHTQYRDQQTNQQSQHDTGRSRSPLRTYQASHQNFMQGRSPSPKRYRDSHNFPSPKHQGPQTQRGQPGQVGTSQDIAHGASYLQPLPAKFGKRYVVIDGSNVAFCHGNGKIFSCRGIQLCIDYFLKRGHTEITAFVPQWRTRSLNKDYPISDQHLLDDLKKSGYLVFTPSRRVPGKNIVCYDDRYVIRLAQETEGVIVSNDNYRDLWQEKPEWRRIIEDRLLMFSFVADIFMPPDDPLGKDGPQLDEFLHKGGNRNAQKNMNFSSGPTPHMSHYQPAQQYRHQQPPAQHRPWAPRQNYPPPHFPRKPAPRIQGPAMAYNKDVKAHGPNQNHRPRNNRPLQVDSVDSASSWQPVGGKKPQQTHVQAKKAKRDPKTTKELETGLRSVFADNDDAITKILSENPSETDLNTLSEYLLNYMGT